MSALSNTTLKPGGEIHRNTLIVGYYTHFVQFKID